MVRVVEREELFHCRSFNGRCDENSLVIGVWTDVFAGRNSRETITRLEELEDEDEGPARL